MFKIYVRGIVFNKNNEILLIKKARNQNIAPGLWLFPGGTTEYGEEAEETLKRELKEEVNLLVKNQLIIDTKKMILNGVHWIGLYFVVSADVELVKNLEPEKHEDIAWFNLDALPVNIDNLEIDFIRRAQRKLKEING